MKKTKLLTIILLASFSSIYMFGKDVYVYNGEGKNPIHSLKNVQKIIFVPNKMELLTLEGELTNIEFADFSFFSFNLKQTNTVSPQILKNNLFIYLDKTNILNIKGEETIAKIELYTIQGSKIKEYTPNATNFSFPMYSNTAGMYLLKVLVNDKEIIHKFIKR